MDSEPDADFDCKCGHGKQSILTFDGGGMRGYASLIFVREFMQICAELERQDDIGEELAHEDSGGKLPLPCHYFDYIAGTSTGGLIAIMLGRLRMKVEDAISAYEDLGGGIFSRRRKMGLSWYKYDHRALERAVVDIVQKNCHDEGTRRDGKDKLLDPPSNEPCCRTLCYAERRKGKKDQLYLFRSYSHKAPDNVGHQVSDMAGNRNVGGTLNHLIWEVARAISAAPTYFEPMPIQDVPYWDAGVEVNNPSWEGFSEAREMHKVEWCTPDCRFHQGKHVHKPCDAVEGGVGILVSVGTGLGAPLSTYSRGNVIRKTVKLLKKAKHALTDTEKTHSYMAGIAETANVRYHRFNVDTGLEKFKMDECKMVKGHSGMTNQTLTEIDKITTKFIRDHDGVMPSLRQCARQLVDMRRARFVGEGRRFYSRYCMPGPLDQHTKMQKQQSRAVREAPSPPAAARMENGGPSSPRPFRRARTQPLESRRSNRPNGNRAAPVLRRQPNTWSAARPFEDDGPEVPPNTRPVTNIWAPAHHHQDHDDDDGPEAMMSPRVSGPMPTELPHEREPAEVDTNAPRPAIE